MHLEYLCWEYIWGEIIVTHSNVYMLQVWAFFLRTEEEWEQDKRLHKKVKKRKVVETDGADGGFFDGSWSAASISLWLDQVVQICGLISCLKCETTQMSAQEPNPQRGLKITKM